MWMTDTDNDGWSNGTTAENPYVNQQAMHSYNVGADLNHFNEPNNLTNTYSVRTIQHWIKEYKIDGYRWDLTKGFTNQCPPGPNQETCTNGYRSDRVAKMNYYADQQWAADPLSLVVFEHLGNGGSYQEELEWSNYRRSGDVGGIMQWRKMTDPYANLLKGQSVNLSGVSDPTDRFIGYAESHDEERVVFKAFNEAGQTQGNLPKILQRLPAMGAVLFLVPGPKMLWHFGELGWNTSLFTCSNGTVQFNDGCKLDTKAQPQWTGNWMGDAARKNVYDTWARLINLKKTENVFENGQLAWNFNTMGQPRLDVFTSTTATPALSYAFVLTNFSDNTINVAGGFPFVGTWTNLMDDTTFQVSANNQNVTIEPGGFRVFGNAQSTLNVSNFSNDLKLALYPNPVSNSFRINRELSSLKIFSTTGQLVKSFEKSNGEADYNVGDLQNGIYFVKAIDANGNIGNMKFIKE
jgi:1,4-alpha-glucan branching enzyme